MLLMLRGGVPAWLESLSLVPGWFWPVYALTLVLTLALVVTMAPAPVAAADPVETPAPPPGDTSKASSWVEPTGAGLVRPDWVSAAVTARSSGQRVEVLAARTGSSRSWMLPTGVVESEATGLVRFKEDTAAASHTTASHAPARDDGWRDIDTTLVVGAGGAGGAVSPVAVPGELVLSGGGDGADLLRYSDAGGRSVRLGSGLPGARLPRPSLDGSTAVYAEVLPGVDIRVQARARGFEQLWVIKDQAGLDGLVAARGAGEVVALGGAADVVEGVRVPGQGRVGHLHRPQGRRRQDHRRQGQTGRGAGGADDVGCRHGSGDGPAGGGGAGQVRIVGLR
ncbi:MAG TPA: hypothetical protein VFN19_06675 [Candidatus Nanopelagicales bacterium]|nr:hypothetical protein [Candidatus Nanopelagicales bacterium]